MLEIFFNIMREQDNISFPQDIILFPQEKFAVGTR